MLMNSWQLRLSLTENLGCDLRITIYLIAKPGDQDSSHRSNVSLPYRVV